MRKFVTLFAATALLASTVALADETTTQTNSNDVLQTVNHQNNGPEGLTVADAANTTGNEAMKNDAMKSDENAAKPAMKKHHHHHMKHSCHHHHHTTTTKTTKTTAENDQNAPEGSDQADQHQPT